MGSSDRGAEQGVPWHRRLGSDVEPEDRPLGEIVAMMPLPEDDPSDNDISAEGTPADSRDVGPDLTP